MNKGSRLVNCALIGTGIVQIIILGFLLIKAICAMSESEVIPYTELVYTTMPVIKEGVYIDNDMPCSTDGLFVYSQHRCMSKGVYRITVNYEADHNGCYSTAQGKSRGIFAIEVDEIPLQTALDHVSFNAYVWSDVEDFTVKYYYGGEGSLIVKDLIIEKTRIYPRLMFCIWFVVFLIIDIIIWKYKKLGSIRKVLYEDRIGIIIMLWSLFLLLPVWDKEIPVSFDAGFHLLRIEGLAAGFREGQFPVKMQSNWLYGYGYPVSLYYGDIFLAVPAIMRIIGFSVGFSYAVLLYMTNLITMATTYWSCWKLTKGNRIIAITCSIIYASIPYRLMNMYWRNAVGENLAIAFLPLVVYGIYAVLWEQNNTEDIKKMCLPLVIGFSGIIQSHMLTCVICAVYVLIVCALNVKKVFQKERFIVLLKTVIYTSLLNAWFIFPCMLSMKNIDVVQPYRTAIRIQDRGAEWKWMFSLLIPGNQEIKSVGFVVGVIIALFILCWIQEREDGQRYGKSGMHFWILTIIAIILSTQYFPWNAISDRLGRYSMVVSNLQFPSRILGLAATGAVICACFTLMIIQKCYSDRVVTVISFVLILLCAVSSDHMMRDRVISGSTNSIVDITQLGRSDLNMGEYIYCKEVMNTVQDYFDKTTDIDILTPGLYATSDYITHESMIQDGSTYHIVCQNQSNENGYIELPILYYDEYQVKDDNDMLLEKECGNNGVMKVILPAQYQGTLHIKYVQPVSWRICEVISVIFILGMFVDAILKQKKRSLLWNRK